MWCHVNYLWFTLFRLRFRRHLLGFSSFLWLYFSSWLFGTTGLTKCGWRSNKGVYCYYALKTLVWLILRNFWIRRRDMNGVFVFVMRTCDSENAGKNDLVANLDWDNGRVEDFSRSAASSASLFYLISSSFLALRWARAVSAAAATAASVPVILLLKGKLRSLGSWSGAGSCSGRLFRLSSLAFKASTIFPVWALKAWANFSAAVPENRFCCSQGLPRVLVIMGGFDQVMYDWFSLQRTAWAVGAQESRIQEVSMPLTLDTSFYTCGGLFRPKSEVARQ